MLFKDTRKFSEYGEIQQDTNFASLRSTIRMVEEEYLVTQVGSALYDALNSAYTLATNEDLLSDSNKYLLDKCRCVVGPITMFHIASRKEITVGDAGTRRQETETSKTANQYQVARFKDTMLAEGDRAIEALLKFLDANQSSYPDWASSEAFKAYRNLFIKSGKEFAEVFPSASPYRNYAAMRSKMQDVEENTIREAIGNTIFNALKAKDLLPAPNFTTKEIELIKKLKKTIGYFTVAAALPFLNVKLDGNGITVASVNRATDDEKASRVAAGNDAINSIMINSAEAGKAWLKNAVKFLDDNAADFDGWPLVEPTETTNDHPTLTQSQDDLNGTFGMF